MAIQPKWANLPNWAENVLVGAVLFIIGMGVSASFTMSERSSLKDQVKTLQLQVDVANVEKLELNSQLETHRSSQPPTADAVKKMLTGDDSATLPTYQQPITPINSNPSVAENGSYYGQLNADGAPKTVKVNGYTRKDGTHVQGHYRSAPSRGGKGR